jgi:hypothetical protein
MPPLKRIRRCVSGLGFAVSAVLACACSTGPVSSYKDTSAPLASYHTFQWLTQADADRLKLQNPKFDYLAGTARIVRRPELEARVRPEIEKRLEKDGFEASVGGTPDFYVTYYGKAKDEDWVSSWQGATLTINNVPVVIFPNFNQDYAYQFREGIIYLVIYDPKTRKPAWTGKLQSEKFGPHFESPEITAAVDQLADNFKASA